MKNTVPETKVRMSRGQKLLVRMVVFGTVIGLLLWWDARLASQPQSVETAPSWAVRIATAAEWQRPIAELGQERLAKLVPYVAVQIISSRGDAPARSERGSQADGRLIWWQAPASGESLSYLPAAGESVLDGAELIAAIEQSRVIIPRTPELRPRLQELQFSESLPAGWTILRPPPSEPPGSDDA